MGNMGDWLGVFLIIAVIFGFGGFGGGRESVREAVDAQSTATGLRDILMSSANNNYETARLISSQTSDLMALNYTNQINVVQGFNAIQQAIANLGSQMDTCCCSIKTQMLQDKYDETLRELTKVQTEASNKAQTEYLLSVMGKWVANPAAVAI
jgi:hypothetical protein